MPFSRIPALLAAAALHANAQTVGEAPPDDGTPVPNWDVFIPEPVADGTAAEPPQKPVPVSTPVISSNTIQRQVTEPSPIDGVPPVTGSINVTLQVVQAPDLPVPPPLPPLPPTDLAVQARLQELLLTYKATELVFVSASVYDNRRTFLRIYPNGRVGDEVTAWSNLDFNVFRGRSSYRVNNSDGSTQDFHLLMGIGDIQTAAMQDSAARAGRLYQPPTIPPLPDLATSGPAFQLVAGSDESPAMDTLEQIHDLFSIEGARLVAEHAARKQAEVEHRAELLANPPQPADVTIRYWKGNANGTEVAE